MINDGKVGTSSNSFAAWQGSEFFVVAFDGLSFDLDWDRTERVLAMLPNRKPHHHGL